MRKLLYSFLLLLCPFFLRAQDYSVQLQSGKLVPKVAPVRAIKPDSRELVDGRYYRYVQFFRIPDEAEKRALQEKGIRLLSYIPNNTWVASIPAGLNWSTVGTANIRAAFPVSGSYKLEAAVAKKKYPKHALRPGGRMELNALYYADLSANQVGEWLRRDGVKVTMTNEAAGFHRILIKVADIPRVAALPYLSFLEPVDDEPQPDNLVGRTDHRSNTLATEYPGGLKYDGDSVVVALNDDGIIGPHIDYTGRIYGTFITNNSGDHGDHCAGIIFGAGNRNPTTRGMASGAKLGVYGVGGFPSTYQAFDSLASHYNKYGVRITSTSYSNGNNAGYTSLARLVDVQINTYKDLMHVFSAGNAGTSTFVTAAGAGWFTITGGQKQGKNCISVGNLTYQDALASSSSRGPAKDGRIKPEICAVGTDVNSTSDPNTYVLKTGTSMSCPGVSGTLAQLYQAYKSTHGGATPRSALIKAAVMNTGDDLGNPGPDFKFGWGRINARRAWNLINNNWYLYDSVTNGTSKNHTITVPAGVSELRVMVYWHDYQATANAAKALVNDLNMTVTTPAMATVLPWKLNPTANATILDQPAVQGVDSLNNMEQVTITTPTAGSYTVNVAGFAVPQGPQPYYVVYEFVNSTPVVTYPIGGESVVPGVQETIRWDAYGNSGTFTVQYSTNGGSSWNTIASSVSGALRYQSWTPPAVVTGQALIRVTRGTQGDTSNAPFSIIGVPGNLTVDWVCVDSMKVSYSAVTGATGYVVTVLGNKYMDSVGYSTTTSCVVKGINTLNGGWFSVQAMGPNGCRGRRAYAQPFAAAPFNCAITNDLAVTEIQRPSPSSVSDCQGAPVTDTVRIKLVNNGLNPFSNITLKYTVNGGAPVTELIAGPLNGQVAMVYSFSQPVTFTAAGTHTLRVWVEHPNDIIHTNDTLDLQKAIIHPPTVSLPFYEDFETFSLCDTGAACEQILCPLINGWTNNRNTVDDDIDWRVYAGPTPTRDQYNTTGPMQDYNPGQPTGKYVYLEADSCYGKVAQMVSPCINLAGRKDPVLTFACHLFGGDMGSLHTDIYADGQWTNDVHQLAGNQGDNWRLVSVPLTAFAGKVINVRFRGITGNGPESDMALDDIGINGTPTGVRTSAGNVSLQVYPNPSTGLYQLQLTGATTDLELAVTDVNGKVVQRQTVQPVSGVVSTTLNLRSAAAGVYFLMVKGGTGVMNRKLVKL